MADYSIRFQYQGCTNPTCRLNAPNRRVYAYPQLIAGAEGVGIRPQPICLACGDELVLVEVTPPMPDHRPRRDRVRHRW